MRARRSLMSRKQRLSRREFEVVILKQGLSTVFRIIYTSVRVAMLDVYP
jgi:DNA-binding CsgD family transcriptional regulator